MPKSDLQLIDTVPILAMHDGECIPVILQDFTVDVYRVDDHLVQLRVNLDGQTLAILPEVCGHNTMLSIESLFMGLHIGCAAQMHGKDIKKFVRSC